MFSNVFYRRALSLFAWLLLIAAPTLAQIPSTQPADRFSFVTRLASEDFSTREAAQKELENVPPSQRPALAKFAEQTTDPEVKARLAGRLQQIDEQLAYDPVPISLHVNDADASALGAALSKAMGVTLVADVNPWQTNPSPPVTFSLDADDKPFWDVYAQLSQQHFLRLARPDNGSVYDGYRLRSFQRFGPFIVWQRFANLSRRLNVQGLPGVARTGTDFQGDVVYTADPRVKVTSFMGPGVTAVIDSSGAEVWKRQLASTNRPVVPPSWDDPVVLPYPFKPGEKFFAQGEVHTMLQLTEIRREIEDIDKHLKEEIAFGACTATITHTPAAKPGDVSWYAVAIQNNDPVAINLLSCVLADSQGNLIHTGAVDSALITGNTTLSWSFRPTVKPPYKLILTVPDKTKEFSFSFKLPLVTE